MTIAALKNNYKEVILSPRVRNVPHHYFLTIFTHFFIIAVSIGIVFLYTYLSTSTLCQAIPLAQKSDTPGLVCESLQLRKDTSVRVQVRDDGDLLEQSFLVGFEMFITDKDFLGTDLSKIRIDDALFQAMQETAERVAADESLATDPEAIVAFYEQSEFDGLLNVTVTEFIDDDVEIDFGDGRGDNGDGGASGGAGGIGGGSIGVIADNGEDFTLLVTWFTLDGDVQCTLRNDFVVNTETRNIIACADLSNGGSPVFQLIWVSEGYLDASRSVLPVNVLAFFQNVHGSGGFVSTLTNSQNILKTIFANNFFSCCFPNQLDNTEYFGIISGIGFLLEGIFTFLVAYIFFRGTLPGKVGPMDDPKELGFSYSIQFGQNVRELYDNESTPTDEKEESISTDEGEIQQKTVHTVARSDIMRVVFNPRCRYIPYSSAVSFITLGLLIGLSAVLALWYQQLRTITVCEPQVASEISGTNDCEDLSLESFVYESVIPSGGSLALPLGILSSLTVENDQLGQLQVEDLFLSEELLTAIDGACNGPLVTLQRCFNDLIADLAVFGDTEGEFNSTVAFRTTSTIQQGTFEFTNTTTNGNNVDVVTIEIEAERVVNGTGIVVFLEENTFHREMGVSYSFERRNLDGDTLVSYSGQYFSTFTSGPEKTVNFFFDTGDIIVAVLQNMAGVNGNSLVIRDPFQSAFTQCCRLDSLEYYDYLGLMMGYVALFEGILTFIVAISFYGGLRLTESARNAVAK